MLPESGANAGRGDMKKAPAIGSVFVAPGFGCVFRAAAATVSIELLTVTAAGSLVDDLDACRGAARL